MKKHFIRFTEDHVAGYPKGAVIKTDLKHSEILVKEGRGEIVEQKDFDSFQKDAPKKLAEYKEVKNKEAKELIEKANKKK